MATEKKQSITNGGLAGKVNRLCKDGQRHEKWELISFKLYRSPRLRLACVKSILHHASSLEFGVIFRPTGARRLADGDREMSVRFGRSPEGSRGKLGARAGCHFLRQNRPP